jgi:hypothetical protein
MDTLFLIANELTLPRLLWRAWRRKPTCALAPRTLVQGHSGLIGLVVEKLRSMGRVKTVADFPDLPPFRDAGDCWRLTNVFAESETWLEDRLGFAGSDRRFGRYGLAFRHMGCNEGYRRFERAYLLHNVLERGYPLGGLDDFDTAFLGYRFQDKARSAITSGLGGALLNLFTFAVVSVATAVWILARIRVSPPPARPLVLASDYQGGDRDSLMWREICEDPAQVQVVFRDRESRTQSADKVRDWPSCMPGDGVFSPRQGLAAMGEALADGVRLLAAGWRLAPDFYRPLATLPRKRMLYRALFNRFRPAFYWGRDDYNTDHIMRTQELRRVGGISVGIMHGLPSIVPFAYQMRHMDFDLYYVHSLDQYQEHYRRYWPAAMRVRAVGSVGLDRVELERLAEDCPGDIAFILGPSFHQDAVFAAVEDLADALPDKTIWINTKWSYRDRGSFGEKFQGLLASGHPNIREFRGRTYDLFFKARYWLSESSTLIAEAVQFGRVGFCLDPDDRFKFLYYRKFPGLIVRDGAEIAAYIRGIEAGTRTYPRADFAPLIRMDGRVCWDLIREDMGLEPKRKDVLPHLAFAEAPMEPAGGATT